MSLRSLVLLSLGLTVLVGCQSKPTVVRETSGRNFTGAEALMGPIVLKEATVIVDARPTFDFSIARIPRSVSINWADYTEAEPAMRGWPQADLFAAARRLARMGIGPDQKVVVFGPGKSGQGEEGRVAWMLAYLGVRNVQFARFGSVKARVTNAALPGTATLLGKPIGDTSAPSDDREAPPPEAETQAVPIWKPDVVESLIVTKEEIMGAIDKRAVEKPWSFEGERPRLYRLIDVRPEKEYLGKTGGIRARSIPNIDAVNVPWKDFFTDDLRPVADLGQRLMSIGVRPEHRVIVIDNDGIASCAATMALRALGYTQAGCYAGGYNDMLSR